jgi:hypothetical protein
MSSLSQVRGSKRGARFVLPLHPIYQLLLTQNSPPITPTVQKYLTLTSGPASIQFQAFLPPNTPYTPLRLAYWVSAGRATYPLLSHSDETGFSLLGTRNYNPLIFHYLGEAMARKDRLFGEGKGRREGELSLEEVVGVVRRCDKLIEGFERKVRKEREEAARRFMEVVRTGKFGDT